MRTLHLSAQLTCCVIVTWALCTLHAQDKPTSMPPALFTNSIGMKLATIPPGEFMMGSSQEDADVALKQMKERRAHEWYLQSPPSETPGHRVRITKPFYFGGFEVTLGDYKKFAEATAYRTTAEKDGKRADGKLNGKWSTQPEFNWKNMGCNRTDDQPVVNITWSPRLFAHCTN